MSLPFYSARILLNQWLVGGERRQHTRDKERQGAMAPASSAAHILAAAFGLAISSHTSASSWPCSSSKADAKRRALAISWQPGTPQSPAQGRQPLSGNKDYCARVLQLQTT